MVRIARRTFLTAGSLAAVRAIPVGPTKIIDTHTHFYDPTRPQGVPWPPQDDSLLYRPVLPAEFLKLARPLGVTGTIEVEASPLLEDNQWVLDLAAKEPIIVGTVGDLEPGKPGFRAHLDRFHKNPLFRGIRIGYLWGRNLADDLSPDFYRDLHALAASGLQIDAVGGPPVLRDVLRISDNVPDLRIVIDHLPFDPPHQPKARAEYESALAELHHRKQVYAKISNVLRRSGNRVPTELSYYVPALDQLWDVFGRDRVVYGSNWPVSNRVAPYPAVLRIVREYFATKGQQATDNYFWRNSQAAYRWISR